MSDATSFQPTINFGGLASGLDTNSIISKLMSVESQPLTRLQQQQAVEQARQATLRDVKTRLVNLQTAAAGLRDIGTWADVQTVDSTDATKISATRTSGAAPGGYQLMVTQLARA